MVGTGRRRVAHPLPAPVGAVGVRPVARRVGAHRRRGRVQVRESDSRVAAPVERRVAVEKVDVVALCDANTRDSTLVPQHLAHLVRGEGLAHVKAARVHAAQQRLEAVGARELHNVLQTRDKRVARRVAFRLRRRAAQALVAERQADDEHRRRLRDARRIVGRRVGGRGGASSQRGERQVEVVVGRQPVVVGRRARVEDLTDAVATLGKVILQRHAERAIEQHRQPVDPPGVDRVAAVVAALAVVLGPKALGHAAADDPVVARRERLRRQARRRRGRLARGRNRGRGRWLPRLHALKVGERQNRRVLHLRAGRPRATILSWATAALARRAARWRRRGRRRRQRRRRRRRRRRPGAVDHVDDRRLAPRGLARVVDAPLPKHRIVVPLARVRGVVAEARQYRRAAVSVALEEVASQVVAVGLDDRRRVLAAVPAGVLVRVDAAEADAVEAFVVAELRVRRRRRRRRRRRWRRGR